MPFTFAHPAIILPLVNRRKVSATGLIVGAMTPDFEYFLRMKVQSSISHTFLGLIVFNVPIAILVSLIFHQILKKELFVNLPVFFQARLELLKNLDWLLYFKNNLLIVAGSVLIGAASHIFWDAFTHKTGYFVENIDFLQLDFLGIPTYKILQHSSSLLGLTFITYVFWKLPSTRTDLKGKICLKFWGSTFAITFLFQCLHYLTGKLSFTIGNLIVSSISLFFVALTLVCLKYSLQKKKTSI